MYCFSNLYGIPLLRKLSIRVYIHGRLEYQKQYTDYKRHCIETNYTKAIEKLDIVKLAKAVTTAVSISHGHTRRCTVVIDDGVKEHIYKLKPVYIHEEVMKDTLRQFSVNENDPYRVLEGQMELHSGAKALASILAIGLIFGLNET